MLNALIILIILAVIFSPQLWVKHVMKKYNQHVEDMPGNGGELARHLVEKFQLNDVQVESIEYESDHYDLNAKKIRLSEAHYQGKSLTAITIAAHEFGHAMQHAIQYKPLLMRNRLAKFSAIAEKYASFLLVSLPFIFLITKLPILNLVILLSGITLMLLPVLFHLVTLPVEFDASFNLALPILKEGGYLPDADIAIAKKILTAAALTYVAASLASLLNVYRWFAILRR